MLERLTNWFAVEPAISLLMTMYYLNNPGEAGF